MTRVWLTWHCSAHRKSSGPAADARTPASLPVIGPLLRAGGAGWQAGQSSFHTSIGHLPENALFFVLFSDLYFKIVKFSFSGVSKLTTTSKSQPWQSTLQNIPLPRHGHQDGCYEKGKNNECWQRCGESGTLAALVRMVMVRPPEKQDGGSSKS